MTVRLAVVGGGIAGLAAALEARARGAEVVLLERRGVLGGRASGVSDAATGESLGAGTHLLDDGATESRALLQAHGVELAEIAPGRWQPTGGWSAAFERLGAALVAAGGRVRHRALVQSVDLHDGAAVGVRGVQRAVSREERRRGAAEMPLHESGAVVCALPPRAARDLLGPVAFTGELVPLATTVVELWLETSEHVAAQVAGVHDPAGSDLVRVVAWRVADGLRATLLLRRPEAETPARVMRQAWRAALRVLPTLEAAEVRRSHVLREPEADLAQPLEPGAGIAAALHLAGDWTDREHAGTIEGAVRSGLRAARAATG